MGLYVGADLSSNFSRSSVQKFNDFFSSPVQHSPEILIERLLIPSNREGDSHMIPVNIYLNRSFLSEENQGKLPSIVYIHGGGWVFAPPESLFYERFTREGLAFIEVRYRLAPENKFPVLLYDCLDVILNETIFKYTNMEKIALLGDSAGGNLVSSLMYLLRDQKKPILEKIKYQFLVYPACGTLDSYPSKEKYNDWYILGDRNMKYYMYSYARDERDFENPYFNVMREKNLKGLPQSYFILSQRDYLFSEGEEYARMMEQLGDKPVIVRKYNIEHSFFKMKLKESFEAFEDMMNFLKEKKFFEKK
jgi:acetyl esterase